MLRGVCLHIRSRFCEQSGAHRMTDTTIAIGTDIFAVVRPNSDQTYRFVRFQPGALVGI